jgi:riboflavin-specific deaminase-like protein
VSASPPAPAEPHFRRLLPDPGTVTADEILGTLDPLSRPPSDRPYTLVNFVASADGRAAFRGRSAPLSDPGDRAMFHGLREHVDAVFAGTGTLRAERYGRLVRDPARRRRRTERGLAPDPLACLITRTGEVPFEIPLFDDPHSRVVIFSPAPIAAPSTAATVETVVIDPGALTLTTAMRRLRADFDVRGLLCEGGPTVFSALLREELVDELFLTIAPKLTGGGSDPTPTNGPELPELDRLELRWLLEREGTLFLRYARHPAGRA